MSVRTNPFGALLGFSVKNPRLVLAGWVIVLAVASLGVFRVEIETSTDSALDRSARPWSFYQRSLQMFGGDEVIVVALRAEEALSPTLLEKVTSLSSLLASIPGVRRVDSLATVPFVKSEKDGSLSLQAFLDGVAVGAEGRAELARRIRRDRVARRTLVSEDNRVVAVNLLLDKAPAIEFDEIVRRVRKTLDKEAAWVSGVPVFRTEINTRTGSEILFFVTGTIIIVAVLLSVWFRSVVGAAAGLSSGAVGSWLLIAAMGTTGQPLMLATMILPSITLALGCAYTMHVLAAARGSEGSQGLTEALTRIAAPIATSGLTTAVGFLGIAAVRIDAIRAVGIFGAVGVASVLAFTLTGTPALLSLLPLPASSGGFGERVNRASKRLVGWLSNHRVWVLAGWFLVLSVSLAGLRLLRVETDAVLWFRSHSDVRRDYDAIRRELSGISPMNVVVESTTSETVTQPKVVVALASLAEYLETLPEVGRAISLADPLRQLHGGFRGDDSQPLPESVELNEQYLLLLESVPHIGDLVTGDRSAASVKLRVDNNGSSHLLSIASVAEDWWEKHGARGFKARATGIMFEFARAQDEISFGQIRGLGLALGCITALFVLVYRRLRIVGIALIPNFVPLIVVFGAMGVLGVPLDAGTVVIGSLALGIAIDDTVHLLAAVEEEQRDGRRSVAAVAAGLGRVLVPVLYTTVAISLGFGILGFSDFTFTRNLGLLTAGIMVVCLLADLVLLPVLLLIVRAER